MLFLKIIAQCADDGMTNAFIGLVVNVLGFAARGDKAARTHFRQVLRHGQEGACLQHLREY